jgi:DNA-binding MarR family transcriptional regulator
MLPDLEAIGMDEISAADVEDLSLLYNGFGQRTRLAILLGFYHGNATTDISDALGITRAGLTNHLDQMTDAGLLKSKGKGYELSVVGRYFAEQIEAEKARLLAALNLLDIAKQLVEDGLEEEVNPKYVSDGEWESMVEREVWHQVESLLAGLLYGDEDAAASTTADSDEGRLEPVNRSAFVEALNDRELREPVVEELRELDGFADLEADS